MCVCIRDYTLGWRRGSVVRTSVFGWQTLAPDLRLTSMTCDHFVGKVSAIRQH